MACRARQLQRPGTLSCRAVGLAALLAPAGGQCTVTNMAAPANGSLPSGCDNFDSIPDGSRCVDSISDWPCDSGHQANGTLPLCSGSTFSPGEVICVGNPCGSDPSVTNRAPGLATDLNAWGDRLGPIDTSLNCQGTLSGAYCYFLCVTGYAPSAPALCLAGAYETQTCDDVDACISYPCGVSANCTDISAAEGGLDNANGRTCTAYTCGALSANALAAAGYTAAVPTAATVPGLGTVGCATGFMRNDSSVPPSVNCTENGGTFSLAGCMPSQCSGTPSELEGFNLTGVTLPTLPAQSALSGLQACESNRVPGGNTALTIRCHNTGLYVVDAGDWVCAPCTAVTNAAQGATYNCSTGANSRVSACAPGHFKLGGKDDVAGTLADEATADQCIACSAVPYSQGSATTLSCTNPSDSRIQGCVPAHFHTVGTDASTADSCTACTEVVDAASNAVVNCTHANNTRVSVCRPGLFKTEAQSVDTADTCWDMPASVKLTFARDYDVVTASPQTYASFVNEFKGDIANFLDIDAARVVVSSVTAGSVVVYFYVIAPLPSAPTNERTTDQCYAHLTASNNDGTLASSGLFPEASFESALVLPNDVPTGYAVPPPPPPPIVCSSLREQTSCIGHGCAWEMTTPRCTTIEEAQAEQRRTTRLIYYMATLLVVMVIVLAVCTCYATKICCFKLQAEHHRISVRAAEQAQKEFRRKLQLQEKEAAKAHKTKEAARHGQDSVASSEARQPLAQNSSASADPENVGVGGDEFKGVAP